jgi:acetyl-CoA acyltransferase
MRAAIGGIGMTRFGKYLDRTLKDLGAEAVHAACRDADVGADAIDAAFVSNSLAGLLTGQESVRAQTILAPLGIRGIPVMSVENACASGSTALWAAVRAVTSGEARCALALGVEKMSHPDRARTLAALMTGAKDVEAEGGEVGGSFMEFYAEEVRHHMELYGSTIEDFAAVAVKNHAHGALNPFAQYQQTYTLEEVLASPEVAWPLTRLMCSPVGDGAAAVLVVPEDADHSAPVVLASILRSGRFAPTDDPNDATLVARAAYEQAGLGPDDVDVAEVHDAAAPAEILAYEDLGFTVRGGGPRLVRDGATALGGRRPVNTSGGLESRGHPIGATGLAMINEIVLQLRKEASGRQVENARVGLVHNMGGWVAESSAACSVHILAAR